MDPTQGRAAEVLEQLARGQGERRSLRPVAVVAAVACLAAVGVAVVLDRRPAPVEERMPLASEVPELAQGGTGSSGSGSGSGPSDEGAEGGRGSAGGADEAVDATAAGGAAGDAPVFVHVAGAVARPGVVELPGGSRVVDAVEAAGGLRADADADRVNLAAVLADGQRVVVPVHGQPPPEEVLPSGPAPPTQGGGAAGGEAGAGTTVELNSATAEQLDSLPGIGPATAEAILAHRERHGPFRTVDELIEVRGIGEAKLEALRDLVTVSGAG